MVFLLKTALVMELQRLRAAAIFQSGTEKREGGGGLGAGTGASGPAPRTV